MPNRIIREGILTSERVNALGWAEEVFYRRLHSVVDDFGRFHAHLSLLRAACYPLHLDKVSDSDIGKWLTACVNAALVRVYPASDGKRYLEVLDFRQQVRAKESRFPAFAGQTNSTCVADATQTISTCVASAHLDVDVVVDEEKTCASSGKPLPAPPRRQSAIPVQEVVDAYNTTLTRLAKVRNITPKRKRAIEALWRNSPLAGDIGLFRQYFEECEADPFLSGAGPYRNGHENWRPDFDYLTRQDVVTKTYERAMDEMEREVRQ